MSKFLVTCSERWSVTYLVEARSEDKAWKMELEDKDIHKKEIVGNEVVYVQAALNTGDL